jgi:hypothetical protein
MNQDNLNQFDYFPSSIYTIIKPEFLKDVKAVSDKYLKEVSQNKDEIYPVRMTGNYMNEDSIRGFTDYILNTAWNILDSQGYAMDNFRTVFTEMWTQEHYKLSSMETHVHGNNVQLVGFYFLDCPKDGSRVVFQDARLGKVLTGLPEKDHTKATQASNMVNFTPEPGCLMMTNSHLPHSFTRNASDDPVRFVHFNIGVIPNQHSCQAPAEVI